MAVGELWRGPVWPTEALLLGAFCLALVSFGDGEVAALRSDLLLMGGLLTIDAEALADGGVMREIPMLLMASVLGPPLGPANGKLHEALSWVANVHGLGEVLLLAMAMLWMAFGVLMDSWVALGDG